MSIDMTQQAYMHTLIDTAATARQTVHTADQLKAFVDAHPAEAERVLAHAKGKGNTSACFLVNLDSMCTQVEADAKGVTPYVDKLGYDLSSYAALYAKELADIPSPYLRAQVLVNAVGWAERKEEDYGSDFGELLDEAMEVNLASARALGFWSNT